MPKKQLICKLAPIFTSKTRLYIDKTGHDGKRLIGRPVDFEPNQEYKVDMSDEFRVAHIKRLTKTTEYTESKAESLNRRNHPFEITTCKKCGGSRGKKMTLNPLEVWEDVDD